MLRTPSEHEEHLRQRKARREGFLQRLARLAVLAAALFFFVAGINYSGWHRALDFLIAVYWFDRYLDLRRL